MECAAAKALGGGAQLWMVGQVSQALQGLRALARGTGGLALRGVSDAHAAWSSADIGSGSKSITRSSSHYFIEESATL